VEFDADKSRREFSGKGLSGVDRDSIVVLGRRLEQEGEVL